MREFSVVVACTSNYCIGYNNSLPWPHLKKDLEWLSKITTNASVGMNAVIMGRLTWESLPYHPLKNRINIVVSSKMAQNDVAKCKDTYVASSLEDGLALATNLNAREVFCLGGAKLYNYAFTLPNCKRVFITRVNYTVQGDAFLNPDLLRPYRKLNDVEFLKVVPYVNVDTICDKGIFFNFECLERTTPTE